MQGDSVEPPEKIVASTVIRNIGQLVTVAQEPIEGASGSLQVIERAALAAHEGRIVWVGPDNGVETLFQRDPETDERDITIVDAQLAVVTPGLVDAHTHLIWAGSRALEFHLRRAGIREDELVAQGGGILSTVEATHAASTDVLLLLARSRLDTMRHHGTTTVEIKTGYGLDKVTEEACLHVINNLKAQEGTTPGQQTEMRLLSTLLVGQALPEEYLERREEYVELVIEEMLPSFVGLAQFCDVVCEGDVFDLEESRRLLTRAKELGYGVKVHAAPGKTGAARLAAEVGAVSVDGLEQVSDEELEALREAGVVVTLLPGNAYTLRRPYPAARRLLDAGVPVALATDFNPATSYCENLQMILGLAMTGMELSLDEALKAVTINGARALGLAEEIGSIEVRKRCELAFWSIADYREIGYHFGVNQVQSVLVQR